MMNDLAVRVRKDGSVIIPASVRKALNITPGQRISVATVDGTFVLVPERSCPGEEPDIAAAILREEGLDMRDWLPSLGEQRERYYDEIYGQAE